MAARSPSSSPSRDARADRRLRGPACASRRRARRPARGRSRARRSCSPARCRRSRASRRPSGSTPPAGASPARCRRRPTTSSPARAPARSSRRPSGSAVAVLDEDGRCWRCSGVRRGRSARSRRHPVLDRVRVVGLIEPISSASGDACGRHASCSSRRRSSPPSGCRSCPRQRPLGIRWCISPPSVPVCARRPRASR